MSQQAALLAQLDEWMKAKEGENIEFKQAKNHFDFEELTRYCCALANEGGGKIILGVTDKRPRKVVGSQAFPQPERTRNGLCQRLPLRIDFDLIAHPDGPVLVLHIPPRPVGTPIQYKGTAWMRERDNLVAMSADRLREIFAESGHDFSADICPGISLADLAPVAIDDFRRRWAEKCRKADNGTLADRLGTLSPQQLLSDAELLEEQNVTYAGLILFGTRKAVGKHLAQAEVIWEYRSREASGPAQAREEFREGFFGFYERLWKDINTRNDAQSYQDGPRVLSVPTFGERPVREAILNAVSHRDYQLGGSVFVRQFSRRLEIDSPGGFPVGINVSNVLDRQNPRNRRIADVFTKCGLVERSGQGMNLIFEESIRQSKPLPDFARTDQYQVGLTLHGTVQNPNFIRFLEKVGQEKTATFTTRDWLLLDLIARDERIKKGYDDQLRRLVDLGVIERVGGQRYMLSRRYYSFTGQPAAYTRKKGLDEKQNLLLLQNHIRDHAATGTKFQTLCEVLSALQEEQVKTLLRKLVRRGEVHCKGKTRAGLWYPGLDPNNPKKPKGEVS
jgi:ATP-dependent DNA helicase RecG